MVEFYDTDLDGLDFIYNTLEEYTQLLEQQKLSYIMTSRDKFKAEGLAKHVFWKQVYQKHPSPMLQERTVQELDLFVEELKQNNGNIMEIEADFLNKRKIMKTTITPIKL